MPYGPSLPIPWEVIANIFNVFGNFLVLAAGAGALLYVFLNLIAVLTPTPRQIPTRLTLFVPAATFLSLLGIIARLQAENIPADLPVGVVVQLDLNLTILLATAAVLIFLVGVTVHSVR